jgi:dipeptidase E
MVKLYLSGGGGKKQSKLIDENFAQRIGVDRTVIYIPIAIDQSKHPFNECYSYIKSVLEPLGVKSIEMWTDLQDKPIPGIDKYSAIYIGGGNTFSLMNQINKYHFSKILQEFVKNGGVVYGGSAGAIIMGKSLVTCLHSDQNKVDLKNFNGLNYLNGYSVWCHYKDLEERQVLKCSKDYSLPIIAIPETSGLPPISGNLSCRKLNNFWAVR